MRSIRCMLGFHAWVTRHNDNGEPYDECTRCRTVDAHMPTGLGWSARF